MFRFDAAVACPPVSLAENGRAPSSGAFCPAPRRVRRSRLGDRGLTTRRFDAARPAGRSRWRSRMARPVAWRVRVLHRVMYGAHVSVIGA